MVSKNQLALRMGEDVDILELFFEALSTPKNSIVTELLSGNGTNRTLEFDTTPEI